MNDTIKTTLVLMIVTVLAGTALAFTYAYAGPLIEEAKQVESENANRMIFPDADSFAEEDGYVSAMQGGTEIGRVYNRRFSGYNQGIEMLIGVTSDKKIAGLYVLDTQESPGLGARMREEWFLDQFIGKDITALDLKKDGGEIDAITSATITSTAVTKAVKETVEGYK